MNILTDKTKSFRLVLFLMIMLLVAAKLREHSDDIYVFYRRQVKDPGIIREYFANNQVRKLQLGAGIHYINGWLNTDIVPNGKIIYLDATARFPFPDGTFQYIFSEHLIEHLSWEGGLKMLKESHRVLAPGGKIRLFAPDLERHIYALQNPDNPEVKKFLTANRSLFGWPDTPIAAAYDFNKSVREWGHQFMYDRRTLRKTLEIAGFKKIREPVIEEKTEPAFDNTAYRNRELRAEVWTTNSFISMIFEAER